MIAYIQILSTSTGDVCPAILVFFENHRYLFNVGEGTQRLCLEQKVKLSKLNHIFLTSLKWDHIGGLPGMVLTVSDTGIQMLSMSGPAGLLEFLTSTRFFMQRPRFHIEVTEYANKDEIFNNGHLRAIPVFLNPLLQNQQTEGKPVAPAPTMFSKPVPSKDYFPMAKRSRKGSPVRNDPVSEPNAKRMKVELRSSGFQAGESRNNHAPEEIEIVTEGLVDSNLPQELANIEHVLSKTVVCYICHSPDIPGKFDPEKAKELGINGPLRGKLCKGQSVVSPKTGQQVMPADCMAKSEDGPIFVVVHCPSLEYMPLLIKHPSFAAYVGPERTRTVVSVIHTTAREVMCHSDYIAWTQSFGPTTQHVIVNDSVCGQEVVFTASAENQFKLNSIHPELFPLPFEKPATAPIPDGYPKNTCAGQIGLQIILAPIAKQGIDMSQVAVPKPDHLKKVVDSLSEVPGMMEKIADFKQWNTEHAQSAVSSTGPNPFLLFLGTGSAIPSKNRNVTGIYFAPKSFADGMLLDAGEGTYGQLYRNFGEKIDEIISGLQLVWISHIHADHHLGLIRILTRRIEIGKENQPPIKVVGPTQVGRWLRELQRIQFLNYEFVDCTDIREPKNSISELVDTRFGLNEFYNVKVIHCNDSYGVVMKHKDDWKLVYSGDTTPCPALVAAGADCTVLVHEATLEDGMEADASDKGHSTTAQAVEAGKKMNAKFTLLTHFSQRYPKIPVLDAGSQGHVGVAFDHLNLWWKDLPVLPKLVPVLTDIFEEEEAEKELEKEREKEKSKKEKGQNQKKKQPQKKGSAH